MPRIQPLLVAALLSAAAPAQSQDFLGGLARAAAARAAQALIDRTAAQVTATPPAATGSPALQPPQTGGRPEMYDASGDRIYKPDRRGLPRFIDQPLWRSAAYCGALVQLSDIDDQDWREVSAKGGHVYDESLALASQASIPAEVDRWRQFGVLRLQIDRPSGGVDFEAVMAEQVLSLRQENWKPWFTWKARNDECTSLFSHVSGLYMNMRNRRGDGSRGAPGQ